MDISDFSDEDFLLSGGNVQVTSVNTIVQAQDGSIHVLSRVNHLALKYLNERKQKQNYINSDRTFREMSTTLSSNFQYTESPMLIDHHESSAERQVVQTLKV